MIKLYVLVAVVAVASAVLVSGTCLTRAKNPEPFLILWNYDTSGYLETCGCSSHQLGGLARRATKINSLRANQPVLAIEGAHFVEDAGEFQLFKGETVIRALNLMGYDAVMLGLREAQHGVDGLQRLSSLSAAPCFSANLLAGGDPWPVSNVVVDVGGTRVGITGVSQPGAVDFDLPADVAFADPAASLDAALGKLHGNADIVVLCLEGENSWIEEMIRDYASHVDLFLTGNRAPASASLQYSANPPRLNNWKLGKYLGIVAVDPAGKNTVFAGMNVPLDDALEDDPQITAMLDTDYKSHLKEKFFGKMKTDLKQLYLPPNSCEPCHTEAYKVYSASRHAMALDTLTQANQVYNPDCMSCHVVYDPDQDELQPINCIVCHSDITEQHIWDAANDEVKLPEKPVATYTYEFCVQCHDELNSLPFKEHWPQYVRQVFHGGDDAAARAAAEQMGLDYNADPPDEE